MKVEIEEIFSDRPKKVRHGERFCDITKKVVWYHKKKSVNYVNTSEC